MPGELPQLQQRRGLNASGGVSRRHDPFFQSQRTEENLEVQTLLHGGYSGHPMSSGVYP